MIKMELRGDEITVLNLLRKSPPYCNFSIEKRPTKEYPDGELSRITVETSTLLKDLLVIDTPMD